MAIKINTQTTEIPVVFGNLEFTFNVSDESIKNFREKALKVQKELESLAENENDDDKVLEKAKEVLKRGFDLMLGEGAFEKIYELSPSVMICAQYFVQLAEGLEQELQKRGLSKTQEELAEKYIKPIK